MNYLTIILEELHSGVQLERVVCQFDFVSDVFILLDEIYHWQNDVNSLVKIYTGSKYPCDLTVEFLRLLENYCTHLGFQAKDKCKLW